MKYVFFTFDGHGLPLAYKLKQEGQEVMVGQVEDKHDLLTKIERPEAGKEEEKGRERRLRLYNGILNKKSAWEVVEMLGSVKNPQEYFLFFDFNYLFRFADAVRGRGFHGNFPTEEDAIYELDRNLAKEFAEKTYPSLHVAEKRDFSTIKDAQTFLKDTEELWVLKGKDEKARTVIPDVNDPALAANQIMEALKNEREIYERAGFILELRIPSIVELTPEKMYYNGKPVAATLDIENKPMGAGNIGLQTGCAADLVFATELENKINSIAFPEKIDHMAAEHEGLFIWDASILIDRRAGKMYFGEYCANRPGYNALFSEVALAGSATKFFENIVKGTSPFSESIAASSVRLFNYQFEDSTFTVPDTKVEFQPRVAEDLWIWDVYKKNGALRNSGLDKNLGVVTGVGHSISEAAKRMYRNIDEFSFEGAYYRPLFDYISRDYESSIINRLNYGLQRGLYKIGFAVD